MISNKTYYLTEQKDRAVEEGNPDARFLLVRAGQEISDADAEKYDLANVKEADESDEETGKGKGKKKK